MVQNRVDYVLISFIRQDLNRPRFKKTISWIRGAVYFPADDIVTAARSSIGQSLSGGLHVSSVLHACVDSMLSIEITRNGTSVK
jgi:hypothetical protein